jgi:hypothetical protein
VEITVEKVANCAEYWSLLRDAQYDIHLRHDFRVVSKEIIIRVLFICRDHVLNHTLCLLKEVDDVTVVSLSLAAGKAGPATLDSTKCRERTVNFVE